MNILEGISFFALLYPCAAYFRVYLDYSPFLNSIPLTFIPLILIPCLFRPPADL